MTKRMTNLPHVRHLTVVNHRSTGRLQAPREPNRKAGEIHPAPVSDKRQ
jgi:hypothetical protein